MWDFINSPENLYFSIAAFLVVALCIVELVGLLLGGLGGWLDTLLPEGLDVDADADVGDLGPFGGFLSWLYIGRIPVLMSLIVFFTMFAVSGYAVQMVSQSLDGGLLGSWVALPVLLPALFLTRIGSVALARVLPQDETYVSSLNDESAFLGRTATVILGNAANPEQACECRVYDQYGQAHYVFVKDAGGKPFGPGDSVILTARDTGQSMPTFVGEKV